MKHTFDGKTLDVITTDYHGAEAPERVQHIAAAAFKELFPYIRDASQSLFIRDIPEFTMEGEDTGGNCYIRHEAWIAVSNWEVSDRALRGTVSHELHHMARWQNNGYGDTLGGSILSEGIAALYEVVTTGVEADYVKDAGSNVSFAAAQAALQAWDKPDNDHSAWFFDGPHGKWVGYNLGILLAKRLFDVNNFDLERSITIVADEAKQTFEAVVAELEIT